MFNITINTKTKEVKQYDFNTSLDFVTKSSKRSKEKQFSLSNTVDNLYDLQAFLGWDIALDDILVDAVDFETGTYWLVVEHSHPDNALRVYQALLSKFDLTKETLLHWAGYLNNCTLNSLEECIEKHCIAGFRVPLYSKRLKIYAHPFRYNSFKFDDSIRQQLLDILNCIMYPKNRTVN